MIALVKIPLEDGEIQVARDGNSVVVCRSKLPDAATDAPLRPLDVSLVVAAIIALGGTP